MQNDGKCHLSPLESSNNILSYNASTTMVSFTHSKLADIYFSYALVLHLIAIGGKLLKLTTDNFCKGYVGSFDENMRSLLSNKKGHIFKYLTHL